MDTGHPCRCTIVGIQRTQYVENAQVRQVKRKPGSVVYCVWVCEHLNSMIVLKGSVSGAVTAKKLCGQGLARDTG